MLQNQEARPIRRSDFAERNVRHSVGERLFFFVRLLVLVILIGAHAGNNAWP